MFLWNSSKSLLFRINPTNPHLKKSLPPFRPKIPQNGINPPFGHTDGEIKICCSHSQLVLSQPGYEFLLVKNKNQIPMRLFIC